MLTPRFVPMTEVFVTPCCEGRKKGRKEMFYLIRHSTHFIVRARCSSVVRAFAHGAMGRGIDPSWGGPIELFLVQASVPRLV